MPLSLAAICVDKCCSLYVVSRYAQYAVTMMLLAFSSKPLCSLLISIGIDTAPAPVPLLQRLVVTFVYVDVDKCCSPALTWAQGLTSDGSAAAALMLLSLAADTDGATALGTTVATTVCVDVQPQPVPNIKHLALPHTGRQLPRPHCVQAPAAANIWHLAMPHKGLATATSTSCASPA